MTEDEMLDALAEAIAEDQGFVVVNDATRKFYRINAERYAEIVRQAD